MSLLPIVLIYAACGLARDWMAARFYQSVYHGRRLSASILSGALTLFDLTIVVTLIVSRAPALLLAYALGTGVGCFLGLDRGKK